MYICTKDELPSTYVIAGTACVPKLASAVVICSIISSASHNALYTQEDHSFYIMLHVKR